jgi:8-oxo-dGTP pyrophosphatase MutT (NUDIX family)
MDPMDRPIDASVPNSRAELHAALAGFERNELARSDLKPASVALCVVLDGGTASLVLTRRTRSMRAHPGQWALPGGRRDAEETVQEAAVRELAEETGIEVTLDAAFATLDDYATRSGYLMTPVVVWAGEAADHPPHSSAEVASVHYVPLADLGVTPNLLTIPESPDPVIQLPLLGSLVHAPTAAIVYQFRELVLFGRTIRVAHFEQPVFAWR